ncbi:hypothetical protein X975_22269, partial [Stegodyphus mimosarum]
MGACFGCCLGKNLRKQSHHSKFLLTNNSHEVAQDEEEFLELEQRIDGTKETPQICKNESSEISKPTKLTLKKA